MHVAISWLQAHLKAELAVIGPTDVEALAVTSRLEDYGQRVCSVAKAYGVAAAVEFR